MQRHNYFPNPNGLASGRQPTELLDCTFRDWNSPGLAGWALVSTNNVGSYAKWTLTGLPSGQRLALLAKVSKAEETDVYRGPILEVTDSSGTSLAKTEKWASAKLLRIEFVVPANGTVNVLFRGRQKTGDTDTITAFYNTRITEAGVDESYFNGNTMPLN